MYTTCGKQVLRNGEDFAQAIDPGAATLIADVLNERGVWFKPEPYEPHVPDNSYRARVPPNSYRPQSILPMGEFSTSLVHFPGACLAYQASDQMLCACGLQWDVNDPDPPRCGRLA